jgi:hypothetical protein
MALNLGTHTPLGAYTSSFFNIRTTRTPQLQEQINQAIIALPAEHRLPPYQDEVVDTPEEGYIRLQNWAFTQGYELVIKSSNANRN